MKNEKKFRLDLSVYQIETTVPKTYADGKVVMNEDHRPVMITKKTDYPFKGNLSDWLRTAGMFENAAELVDAVMLAREIRKATSEFLLLDAKEASTLRLVVDKLIKMTADGKAQLGGAIHEEAICRVVNMEELTG